MSREMTLGTLRITDVKREETDDTDNVKREDTGDTDVKREDTGDTDNVKRGDTGDTVMSRERQL